MIKRAHNIHAAAKVTPAVDVEGIVGAGQTTHGVQAAAQAAAKADVAANDTKHPEGTAKAPEAAVAADIALSARQRWRRL